MGRGWDDSRKASVEFGTARERVQLGKADCGSAVGRTWCEVANKNECTTYRL